MSSAGDHVIIALDVSSLDAAEELATEFLPFFGCFKIGLALATAAGGAQATRLLQKLGATVFYDQKFNDIPVQVGQASAEVAALGVRMFSVHASAGTVAMRAAAAAKGNAEALAVTVLTSHDAVQARFIFGTFLDFKVRQFAEEAHACGMDGIIASPRDLAALALWPEFGSMRKITPSIRPLWAPAEDQARAATPAEAIRLGADMLVIGRPITNPPREIGSRTDAAKRILEEVDEAINGKEGQRA